MQVAKLLQEEKEEFFSENNMHNLTNVYRKKSDMGFVTDYPHYYEMKREGNKTPVLFAVRYAENSEFIFSRQEGDFTMYGKNYVGVLKPNFAGTWFELYDFGYDAQKESN